MGMGEAAGSWIARPDFGMNPANSHGIDETANETLCLRTSSQ
jgi:hypothetical protein